MAAGGVEKTAASRRRNWGRWTAALAAWPKIWICKSRTPSQWLVGCSFWTLRFAACSSGANLNQTSFSWRSAGICAFRFRTATSKSLLAERGLRADHVTVWRWVQRYAPGLERRLRRHLKPTNDSWRVDEMYVRVKGKWVYLPGGGLQRCDDRLPSLG
jgi:hypothetical protein